MAGWLAGLGGAAQGLNEVLVQRALEKRQQAEFEEKQREAQAREAQQKAELAQQKAEADALAQERAAQHQETVDLRNAQNIKEFEAAGRQNTLDREAREQRALDNAFREKPIPMMRVSRSGVPTDIGAAEPKTQFFQEPAPTPIHEESLVKVEHKDPVTGRTIIEYLPKADVRGKTFDKGTPGIVENRLASAKVVRDTGTDMIRQLSDPAYAQAVGPAMGRFNTLQDFIGNPPPEFAELAGQIESYALANMGVHGMRSVQGAEHIKKLLTARHTPQSLIAAIHGLNNFSEKFLADYGRGGDNPANNRPKAAGGETGPRLRYNPQTGRVE